ncbi:helix-turn-helix domain-containing protein [Fusibacter bizertensis]
MYGLLIKKERISQNMSQEALCKGICAVSYLSKIENGVAKPSHEILVKLMDVLGVMLPESIDDLAFYETKLLEIAEAIKFERYDKAEKIYESLQVQGEMLSKSPLMISWRLIQCYLSRIKNEVSLAEEILTALEPYLNQCSNWQNYHYYILKAKQCNDKNDFDMAIELYKKAQLIENDGYVLFGLASSYYNNGDYLATLKVGNDAYRVLMEEGNFLRGIEVSFTLAGAYSNEGQMDQAIIIYKRLIHLSENEVHKNTKYDIYYNIGATYLMNDENELALKYLKMALERFEAARETAYQIGLYQQLFLTQKLILCYLNLGNLELAREWIVKANQILVSDDAKRKTIYQSLRYSFEWLSFYLMSDNPIHNPDFLSAIERTYLASKRDSHFGFHMMYGHYLIQAYTAQRKYKEALNVSNYLRVSWKTELSTI